jgi:fatty-acyl-CoA synthase/long-chain acyl-CoA synthetase
MFTLNDLFDKAFEQFADRTLAKFPESDTTLTYAEMDREAELVARGLRSLGIDNEDRIGIYMANVWQNPVANIGLVRAGGALVLMNHMLAADDIAYLLRDSDARAIFVGEPFVDDIDAIKDDLPELEFLITTADESALPDDDWYTFEGLQARGEDFDGDWRDPTPGDRVMQPYTSGTTGDPKGLKHTHDNFVQNLYAHLIEVHVRPGEQLLLVTSLAHSACAFFWTGLIRGGTCIVTDGFDPEQALSLIETEEISWTFMVPTVVYNTLDHPAIEETDTSSLDTLVYGAAPMTPERLREGIDAFGDVFVQFYGQAEVPNLITSLDKDDHDPEHKPELLSSCGQETLMSEVKIVDLEDGTEITEPDEAGEIVARASYQMEGYYELPEKTAETIKDGWVHTGDVGKFDEDGYVYLLDRTNDVIISGGLNVYTTEVEEVIQEHAAVSQVAVIGVPDDQWGERVHAVIVPYEDADISEDDVIGFADGQLADYSKPKTVEFREELPLTPFGKIDKSTLREPFWEEEERQIS